MAPATPAPSKLISAVLLCIYLSLQTLKLCFCLVALISARKVIDFVFFFLCTDESDEF